MKLLLFIVPILFSKTHEREIVELAKLDFSIKQEIRYATKRNAFGKRFYKEPGCFLEKKTAEALVRVQSALKVQGFGIKVWDCERDVETHKRMVVESGISEKNAKESIVEQHISGNSVDVTLVDTTGNAVVMPNALEDAQDFSYLMHKQKSSENHSALVKKHSAVLKKSMQKEGFKSNEPIWWHFTYHH